MPQVGETKRNEKYQLYIWAKCEDCGKERWVLTFQGKPRSKRCHCAGGGRGHERKGRHKQRGYVLIKLKPEDFFYPMANNRGYVREHRLVMAKHLGRNLHTWEIIHHRNGIQDDNKLKNLQLCLADGHNTITRMQNRIEALEQKIAVLLQENNRLKQ